MRRKLFAALGSIALILSSSPQGGAVTYPDIPRVKASQAPYLINLWNYDENSYNRTESFCSGTMLDEWFFVTAAHCVIDEPQFVIVAGQESESERGIPLSVFDWVIHPRYSQQRIQNDIAVGMVNFEYFANSTIKLPAKTSALVKNKYKDISGLRLFGWGVDQNERKSGYPMSVRQVDYSRTANKFFDEFNLSTNIAAGSLNKVEKTYAGACHGDSGGPLVSSKNGTATLIGVVSYGSSSGCDAGVPTIYTRVSYYVDFISQAIESLEEDFAAKGTSVAGIDSFSKPANSDEIFPSSVGQFGNKTYIPLQEGGGVASAADVVGVMLQSYTAASENDFAYGLNFYFKEKINPCVEKQKGTWRIQMALDSRQRVDLQIEVNPGSGCYESGRDVYEYAKTTKSPPSQSVCTSNPSVRAWGTSEAPQDVDVVSFFFSKGCFGTSEKVWLRVLHRVDGQGDLEPGVDLWAGPFSTALPK